MSGLGDKLKGSVKEAAGKITGNENLEAEGKVDQIKGNLKDKAKDVKGAVGEKANEVLGGIKKRTDNDKK